MKRFLLCSLLAAAALTSLPATETKPTPQPGKGRLTDRIDALLLPHLKPAALPVVLPNPFVLVRGPAETAETPEVRTAATPPPMAETGALTDAEVLASCVARLRIGGVVEVGNITKLIINQTPYGVGDTIMVEDKSGRMIALQIVRLTGTELTLGLDEAAQIIRLKSPARPRDAEKEPAR